MQRVQCPLSNLDTCIKFSAQTRSSKTKSQENLTHVE